MLMCIAGLAQAFVLNEPQLCNFLVHQRTSPCSARLVESEVSIHRVFDLPCLSTTKSPFNFSPWKAHTNDRLDLRVCKQDSGTMRCWPVRNCTPWWLKALMDSGVSARPSWKLMVLTTKRRAANKAIQ